MATLLRRLIRRVTALLIRGPEAPFVMADLDEAMERDLERGVPLRRARWRYAVNLLGSAASIGRSRLRMPNLNTSWLDVKLGLRMLVKHPGLTLVAVFALAIGIPASLIPTHMFDSLMASLPFEEGERIVGLGIYDANDDEVVTGSLHEFELWRDELTTFDAVGAARSQLYNVLSEDTGARPTRGAEVTASAFGITRVLPLLGRTLVNDDEVVGAPDVVVIGYDLWQSRLGRDPGVVGRLIRIGGVPHEVVGVMPEGFLFPVRDHLWIPLRAKAVNYVGGQGPEIMIFGRLSDGVSMDRADAEVRAVGGRLVVDSPDPRVRLQPGVVPFYALVMPRPEASEGGIVLFYLVQLFPLLLLAIVCGNVGILIFARTATRSSEISIRTALGASRGRVVSQLFVESLVLALLATGVGLVLADQVGARFTASVPRSLAPFWLDFGLTSATAVKALGVAVFSAVVAGVVPALKATGRGVQRSLQRAASGGSGLRFGRISTVLIVAEVALGVFSLFLGGIGYRYVWFDTAEAAVRSDRILSAQLTIPRAVDAEDAGAAYTTEFRQQLRTTHQELARRLALEPGVRGVAMANVLPGQDHFGYRRLEVEGSEGVSDYLAAHQVSVSVGFFGVLGQPILRGRDLAPGDLPGGGEGDGSAVIVNNAFVDNVLGGRNPIGQRVRFVASRDEDPHPWYEIVGLVGTLDMGAGGDLLDPPIGIYLPTGPGELNPLQIVIDVGTDPASFASRLREIASEVDPSAMVEQTLPLDQIVSANRLFIGWAIILMVATAGVAVVLSIAGVYALMSFTVAQRTREIGIRTALGAPRESIVSVIVRRAFGQLALGVLLGVAGGVALATTISVQDRPAGWLSTLALVAGMTVSVGLLACIVPTLRGLRIPPTEALRADG